MPVRPGQTGRACTDVHARADRARRRSPRFERARFERAALGAAYPNGLDSELQRIGPRLSQAQFDIMVRNRVTQALLRQPDWDTPAHVAESLRLLDEHIWHGIQYLARRAATDGAVLSAGLRQLKGVTATGYGFAASHAVKRLPIS